MAAAAVVELSMKQQAAVAGAVAVVALPVSLFPVQAVGAAAAEQAEIKVQETAMEPAASAAAAVPAALIARTGIMQVREDLERVAAAVD